MLRGASNHTPSSTGTQAAFPRHGAGFRLGIGPNPAPDDTIIVASNSVDTGPQRVSAAGGPMMVLTRPDPTQGEADHFWPEMLPGGRAVLLTIMSLTGDLDAAQVAVLDLQTEA